ncbi:TetR/AcrR family transcriptional regulator [Streptomyces sp. NPDC006879]|uniref:TetR/AcrR family transcriptional regulator n=1 Tax=Streptomyces sp. NPDC006879 TaxID=3364767 RepID=UPI0036CEC516
MATAADPAKADGPARTSVWRTVHPGVSRRRSGREPALCRGSITAAAVRLLDSDGLSRFSMRRLAGELGVTAMSLYWYVDTKHDLLELALDAAIGELPPSSKEFTTEGRREWSNALRALALGYRRLLVRHPWLAVLAREYPNIGPHATAFDQSLCRLLAATGLAPEGRAGARLAVTQFLQGCAHPCGAREGAPEAEFAFAVDVLVAGIEAKRPRPGPAT